MAEQWQQGVQDWVAGKVEAASAKAAGMQLFRERFPARTKEELAAERATQLLEYYRESITYYKDSPARGVFDGIAVVLRAHFDRVDVVEHGTDEDNFPSPGIDAKIPQLQLRFGFERRPDGFVGYRTITCTVDTSGTGNIFGLSIKGDERRHAFTAEPTEESIGLEVLGLLDHPGTAIASPLEYPEFYTPPVA